MDTDSHEPLPGTNRAPDPDDPVQLRAAENIETVRGLLDEELMIRLFDEPIGRALEAFECLEGVEYSHGMFLKKVADFVRHVYEHGLRSRCRLTETQAHDEAIALLRQVYGTPDYDGYDGAAAEAANPSQPGILVVVTTLAEALKARERQKYVAWVTARYIDAADWNTRCAMAAILLERQAEFLQPEPRRCRPEPVADRLVKLLAADVGTDRRLGRRPL